MVTLAENKQTNTLLVHTFRDTFTRHSSAGVWDKGHPWDQHKLFYQLEMEMNENESLFNAQDNVIIRNFDICTDLVLCV